MASLFDQPDPTTQRQARLFDRSAPNKGVGIHYTDPGTIMKIIEPVVMRPLRTEWEGIKEKVRGLMERRVKARSPAEKTKLLNEARDAHRVFRMRLGAFRVLDPACGSGNFLALALSALKDFDLAVLNEASALELPPDDQRVGPDAVLGIEINPYAAELARLTVWITELQWQLRNSFGIHRAPILGRLEGIVCRDALVTREGGEAVWPESDVAIGNPPFLGDKAMIRNLGEDYVASVRRIFEGRIPGGADLVCYWFEKARECLNKGRTMYVGLVATNSIRGGANRRVLDRILETSSIFEAWSDEPWVVDGAAVRVSMVCFCRTPALSARLDGRKVQAIFSDLTAAAVDLTKASSLVQNQGTSFIGTQKNGPFDVPGELARQWLLAPLNPNGRPNSDVIKPWVNGLDITRRPSDTWIIDFGNDSSLESAALYEKPFAHVERLVKPTRERLRREGHRKYWWIHGEARPGMRKALQPFVRYIVTPRVSKHRLFVWMPSRVLPDSATVAIARDDGTSFGILQSRFHEAWSLALCTWLGVGNDPRYTPSTTFETFPFPEGLTPDIPAKSYASDPRAGAIAATAKRLDDLRQNWLNPPDLVKLVPEIVPGYPDRILPVDAKAAEELKKRTLTKLYNEKPAWLANAHRDLDAAVAAAYGWPADISEGRAGAAA